jgi:hypothetical protein
VLPRSEAGIREYGVIANLADWLLSRTVCRKLDALAALLGWGWGVPVGPAVLANDVGESNGGINRSRRKRYQRRYVITRSGGEIRFIKPFIIAEDFAMVTADGFAWHCQYALQDNGIVATQGDDVSVM